jgi:hypothetical protein
LLAAEVVAHITPGAHDLTFHTTDTLPSDFGLLRDLGSSRAGMAGASTIPTTRSVRAAPFRIGQTSIP